MRSVQCRPPKSTRRVVDMWACSASTARGLPKSRLSEAEMSPSKISSPTSASNSALSPAMTSLMRNGADTHPRSPSRRPCTSFRRAERSYTGWYITRPGSMPFSCPCNSGSRPDTASCPVSRAPVQGFAGHVDGAHIKTQHLEVLALKRLDVRDGGVDRARPGWAHCVGRKAPLAHVGQVRRQGRHPAGTAPARRPAGPAASPAAATHPT